MKELTCIVCPNGCRLKVTKEDGEYRVEGHKCKRGIGFAVQEMEDPRRSVCTTVKTAFKAIPRLSVRTDGEIKKENVPLLMKRLRSVEISELLDVGDIIIRNIFGSDVNVIATSSLIRQIRYTAGR